MPSASFGKPDDAQPSALGATWFVRFTDGKKRKSKVVLCLSDDVVSLIIYSSAAGGTFVQKKTEQLNSIVTGLGGKPSVVSVLWNRIRLRIRYPRPNFGQISDTDTDKCA